VAEDKRGEFSAQEATIQNLFELLSFASTVVYPKPEQFQTPVLISLGAVILAAVCFAAYVRKQRGHLIHLSKCFEPKRVYRMVHDEHELEG
jgi:iron-regulated transporter 1